MQRYCFVSVFSVQLLLAFTIKRLFVIWFPLGLKSSSLIELCMLLLKRLCLNFRLFGVTFSFLWITTYLFIKYRHLQRTSQVIFKQEHCNISSWIKFCDINLAFWPWPNYQPCLMYTPYTHQKQEVYKKCIVVQMKKKLFVFCVYLTVIMWFIHTIHPYVSCDSNIQPVIHAFRVIHVNVIYTYVQSDVDLI